LLLRLKPPRFSDGEEGTGLAVGAGVTSPLLRIAGVGAPDRLDSVGRSRWMLSKTSSDKTPFSRRLSSS
jgi:hypothetical protein